MVRFHLIRVVIGCVLGLVAGVLYWQFAPKVYEYDANVVINSPQSQRASAQQQLIQQIAGLELTQTIGTEMQMLRSEDLFRRALADAAVRYPSGILDTRTNRLIDSAEAELYGMYDVEAVDRESNMAVLTVRAHSPELVAELTTDIVQEYNNTRKNMAGKSADDATAYVNDKLFGPNGTGNGIVDQLNKAEGALAAAQRKYKMPALPEATQALAEYQSKLQQQLDDANTQLKGLQSEVAVQSKALQTMPKTMVQQEQDQTNPRITELNSQQIALENQRADLLKIWVPGSTKIKAIDSQIADVNRRLADEKNKMITAVKNVTVDPVREDMRQKLTSNLVAITDLQARQRAMQAAVAVNNKQIDALPSEQQEITQLTRNADVLRQEYLTLKNQGDQISLQKVTAIDFATPWFTANADDIKKPVSPVPGKALPIGAILGGVIMLLLSLGRESLRSTVRTSSELSTILELPVAGTAPMLSSRKAQQRLRALPSAAYSPMESFRFMAASGMIGGAKSRSVLFTSVGGGVGCSSSAGEYAIASARMGVKTVLVDADLTFSTLSSVFGVASKSGLRDIINQVALPSPDGQVAIATNHENLTILPAGSKEGLGITDVPVANLESIVRHLGDSAELIVLDCPPLDVLADASRFVPYVDDVYLVVSSRKSSLSSIARAEVLLRRCGAKSVSVVLTGTLTHEEAFTRKNRYQRGAA